jgi:hypothetical protein
MDERCVELTSSAVKVGEVEDISRAAERGAGVAETNLTLLKRGSEGHDGESEDGGVKHIEVFEVGGGKAGWSVCWLFGSGRCELLLWMGCSTLGQRRLSLYLLTCVFKG